ncbi:MAG: hydrogenase maturation nickel metallochaperone HypA [Methanobacteriota archaeon]|nr:MAG: hydrogenase maturation nickel metallochaperone HypA [Euryarchaeota archaeon]
MTLHVSRFTFHASRYLAMHEMSIAQNIIDIVNETLREYPNSRVEKVVVDVGVLTAVVPESLEFCYSAITAGTPLENSVLEIHHIPLRIKCNSCQKESSLDSFIFVCPSCGSSELTELSGRELNIRHIEVEE